ncbi:hypothetical protein EDB81DRAFT_836262 [Dactylonectria macrodidyma]|uniref:NmrA-like domain-containing protein n=1 Tax=Dactylonectria macrodidyma TaxID=307937 RepID=A0A9P9JMW3_9HYPO|nr:hypothetical protein EDB81DRAFT_836262 [Dactylonectria macrodidyma]
MAVVAVAGGTGGVGKTIVKQLQISEKHQVLILSRKPDAPPFVVVMEEHNIDTVISTIGLQNPVASQSQLNLIAAADKSGQTRRFIPTLKKSSLKYTRFTNGWFMDYFGLPNIQSDLSAHVWALDVATRRAAIPGAGNEPLTLTYSVDVARFVVRLLDDEGAWPEHSIISGSDTTFNQMLAHAENITGKTFDVIYDSKERLMNNKATLLSEGYGAGESTPEVAEMMTAMFGRMTIEGRIFVPNENRLNHKYPEILPVTVEELLTKAWARG